MTKIINNKKGKNEIFFTRIAFAILTLSLNLVTLFLVVLYFRGSDNLLLFYILLISPSYITSCIFILVKNNSIQDFVSGITYIKNTKIRLLVKTTLKHLFFIVCFSVYLFSNPIKYKGSEFFVFVLPLLSVATDFLFLTYSKSYTSLYNLIVGIKKEA